MESGTRLSLVELEASTGVSARQIRELIRRGLLPRPSSGGRGATYGVEHRDRLRVWKLLREKSPPGTTNDQLQVILERLSPAILHGIAEGTIPFALVDDGRREVTIAEPFVAKDSGRADAPKSNERALAYLAALRGTSQAPPARVAVATTRAREPRVELDLFAAERSNAAVPLERLRRALAEFAARSGGTARLRPQRSEVWHRVGGGRDLEISARGPLTPDELDLLEQAGALLQQVLYR
jgi:DNA-binding transcriptional MerR regulator